MAATFLITSLILPVSISILMAIGARLILTGAFHEDGLGDFFDGFGGGHSREQILSIMKDSHVGSYAVVGYILYYALLWQAYIHLGEHIALLTWAFVFCDVLGKWVSSWQVQLLPYARKLESSKTGVVYAHSYWYARLVTSVLLVILGLLSPIYSLVAFGLACLAGALLIGYIRRRIGGYTGDTCGALSLIVELTALLTIVSVTYMLYS